MAFITPFQGLRFTSAAGDIRQLTCPPYDIISEEERLEYLRCNPHNVIRLELPKEGDDPYAEAGKILRSWLDNRILQKDAHKSLYIYEEEFENRGKRLAVKGFICRVKLEEFSRGVILPHEETLSKAKADRLNLMKATGCNFSQIYSLYMDNGTTSAQIENLSAGTPDVELTDAEGVTHRLWVADDPDAIQAVCAGFAERKLYIADGHHRYETALNYRNYLREQGLAQEGDECDYIMMMLVAMDHPGLVVYPTHRIVRGLDQFDPTAVIHACQEQFTYQDCDDLSTAEQALEQAYEQGRKAFVMVTSDHYTLLTLKDPAVMHDVMPGASDALCGLDVNILHTLILDRILGIDKENMANQKNLVYTRCAQEAVQTVQNGNANCAFLLNPTRITEIRDVSLAGEKMPQKSTYFYPKLITGLVMNQMFHPF